MKVLKPRIFHRHFAVFMAFLMLFSQTGCRYFMVSKVDPNTTKYLDEIGELYKYFVIHDSKENEWHLDELDLNEKEISGKILKPDRDIHYFPYRTRRYRPNEKDIVYEAHIYLNNPPESFEEGDFKIALEDLKSIYIIDKDTGRTVASFIFTTIGVMAGAMVILLIVILLTKSSCPFIYVHDGEVFVFQGETFGGALNANLEREDFMPLPMLKVNADGDYKIRITNELKERQYTDFAHLLEVDHPLDSEVILDSQGNPRLMKKTEQAVAAFSDKEGDFDVQRFAETDNEFHFFTDLEKDREAMILKFEKPKNTSEASLSLNVRNSLWLDYLYGKFLEKFGSAYNTWAEKHAQKPTEEQLEKIKENGFPLDIFIKNDDGNWELIESLPTVGPLIARDMVVPIDLKNHSGEMVEIKFETGFNFWEIDKALIDFTPQEDLKITRLLPENVKCNVPGNHQKLLAENDGNHMAQLNVGDVAELTFSSSEKPSETIKRSVFLHTKGYYELIRDFEGLPEIFELNKFKKAGHFMQFSREEYLNIIEPEEALAF